MACLVLNQSASSVEFTFVHLVSLHHSVHLHQIVDDIKDVTVAVFKPKEVINKLIFLRPSPFYDVVDIGWSFVINYKLPLKTIPIMKVKVSVERP